jgi:hypothetical protein
MQDVTETGEEVLWTLGFAAVAGTLLFALYAGTSWAATMLGSWAGPSDGRLTARRAAATLSIVLRQ